MESKARKLQCMERGGGGGGGGGGVGGRRWRLSLLQEKAQMASGYNMVGRGKEKLNKLIRRAQLHTHLQHANTPATSQ